jgi:2-iminobutanoate/2-iminopropanoate deaminase
MKPVNTTLAPAAIGPYSQAAFKNGMLFISGQLGIDPNTGNLAESFEAQSYLVFNNLKAILEEEGMSFANAVKVSVFVTDMNNFAALNEIYKQYFSQPFPAREVIQVAGLPKGGDVEISLIAMK